MDYIKMNKNDILELFSEAWKNVAAPVFVKHEMRRLARSTCGPPSPEPTCCLSVPTTGPVPRRSGVPRRRGAVRRLRGSHRRPLPAARERALLARDLRQVRGVFKCADRDLLLQGPPAVLQARL